MRVARVRAIFSLPSHIAHYSTPLVYVDYFTEFNRYMSANVRMHEVQHALEPNGMQSSGIIPLTSIVRSCHLIPKFGEGYNHLWSAEEILDNWDTFFVNDFLDIHSYTIV
jgi:hypothetical protein